MKAAFPENNEFDNLLDTLLERADLKGHLTFDDLEEIIPQSGSFQDQLEEVVGKLSIQGVEILNTKEDVDTNDIDSLIAVETDMDPTTGFERVPSEDTISLYLREMSRVPLLNMEQEVSLAKRYEAGKAAHQKMLKANGNLSGEKRAKLENVVEDGLQAREHLIKANTRLVVSVAKRYNGRGVPFLDLIQEGNLGLMKAVEKYDYRKGFRFSTYATWWIRQTITRAIADQGRTIRVPVHMVDRIRVMYKRTHELEQTLDENQPPMNWRSHSTFPRRNWNG